MSEQRTIIITGGSSGIGKAAATELATQGNNVIITGRNPQRTQAVADEIGGTGYVVDFEKLDSIRAFADTILATYPRIDVLANNAGGMYNAHELTADGFERTIQTNYLAPYLLTRLLLPRLIESHGRVITTSSNANAQGKIDLSDINVEKTRFGAGLGAYGASKLEVNLFTTELVKRTGIAAYTFHPGFVRTGLAPDWWVLKVIKTLTRGRYGIAPEEGAKPLIRLASLASIPEAPGTYFEQEKPNGRQGKQAGDTQLAEELWDLTSTLVSLPAMV
jgi:NAD(P)-dependent dehydrogenase (short-subunit alcohol dehydrogenase family)